LDFIWFFEDKTDTFHIVELYDSKLVGSKFSSYSIWHICVNFFFRISIVLLQILTKLEILKSLCLFEKFLMFFWFVLLTEKHLVCCNSTL